MANEIPTFYEHVVTIKDEFTRKIVLVEWAFKEMPELAAALTGDKSMEEVTYRLKIESRAKQRNICREKGEGNAAETLANNAD